MMGDELCHPAGLVLAGGRGRRMAGLDKGLSNFQGLPLIEHVLIQLAPQCTEIIISANRNHWRYRRYGCPLLADDLDGLSGYPGPLAGIATGLRHMTMHSPQPWLFYMPVDALVLPADLVTRLSRTAMDSEQNMVVVRTRDGRYPLCGLVHASLLDGLLGFLQQGGRSYYRWITQQNPAVLDYNSDWRHRVEGDPRYWSLNSRMQHHALKRVIHRHPQAIYHSSTRLERRHPATVPD